MIFHPFTSQLIDFAQGTLDTERQQVVSQHLARCSRCRRTVMEARRWIRESQEGAPKPSAGLRSRILHAATRGTQVVLPIADPGSPAFPKRRVAWSAAAAVGVTITPIRTWRGLYHAYGREVYRYARWLTGSHDDAVELIRRVRLRMATCDRNPD